MNEEEWTVEFVKQVFDEIPAGDTSTFELSELRNRLTSVLEEVRDDNALPTQASVYELYSTLVSQILQDTTTNRTSRRTGRKQSASRQKRKQKRYTYGRTQELYKQNPGVLAKYIREGTPWLDDHKAVLSRDTIKEFSSTLWGQTANITIPFNSHPTAEMPADALLRVIAKKESQRDTTVSNKEAPPDSTALRRITSGEQLLGKPFGFFSTLSSNADYSRRIGAKTERSSWPRLRKTPVN
jgi:hypothetical protein